MKQRRKTVEEKRDKILQREEEEGVCREEGKESGRGEGGKGDTED